MLCGCMKLEGCWQYAIILELLHSVGLLLAPLSKCRAIDGANVALRVGLKE